MKAVGNLEFFRYDRSYDDSETLRFMILNDGDGAARLAGGSIEIKASDSEASKEATKDDTSIISEYKFISENIVLKIDDGVPLDTAMEYEKALGGFTKNAVAIYTPEE